MSKSRNDKKVKKPKTPSSFRPIPIGDKLIKDLLTYKDWQKQNKEIYGEKYIEQDHVITTWNGRPLGPYGINKVMKTIIDKTNLPKISPHGLRHTHAIMMLESGNDIKVVSERLGHSALIVTSDVYLHITKKHEMESVNRLEKYLEADEE
ncbi:MAG: tyrosine-type recombinase/integrase [Niallia nealsonii]|nr:tyrosine-type recombinase/integrase [Niallia nealsonii]MED3795739.1 tyrosine-type recombinase/integrase [Niallia alba]